MAQPKVGDPRGSWGDHDSYRPIFPKEGGQWVNFYAI